MGGCKEDHGVNGWVERGKSSGRPLRKWVGRRKETFRKTTANYKIKFVRMGQHKMEEVLTGLLKNSFDI